MTAIERSRPASLVALLVVAISTGALAGLIGAGFIWLFTRGAKLLWSDLPDALGVEAYSSWWLFAVPIVGGALVGVCQHVVGNYPRPIEEAIATWKSGGHIEPIDAPRSALNSLVALIFGGPVGFEAALTGLLGGTGTWVSQRITGVGHLVRQAWGAERIDSLPSTAHHLPYWLAAVSGLVTYRWLPFGTIDLGFRFDQYDGGLSIGQVVAVFAMAAFVIVPVAWAISMVTRAEHATLFQRSPILIGMAGGLVFAFLAIPNEVILFSGQEGIQQLPGTDNVELLYITVAKWLALVVALLAGWRGGPVFPTYTAVAAFAVLADEVIDVGPDLLMVAAITGVSVVFLKGSIPMAFVLTLYPVPLSYAGVILIGCAGGALALALAASAGVLPRPAGVGESPATEPDGTSVGGVHPTEELPPC